MVKGGDTVCAAEMAGKETTGMLGGLPENCVTCWAWSRSPIKSPYPPRRTSFGRACHANPARGPKLVCSPSTIRAAKSIFAGQRVLAGQYIKQAAKVAGIHRLRIEFVA